MEGFFQHPRNEEFVHHSFHLLEVLHVREGDESLDHIKKLQAFLDQFASVEVPMRNKYLVMTFLESLGPLYEYLITALDMMLMKELIMVYMMARLMYEMSRRNNNELQEDDATMVLHFKQSG